MQQQFTSGSRQAPDPHDRYLEANNFYRKHTARDPSSLFRVVSEQMFDTQQHHFQVRKRLVRFMRHKRNFFDKLIEKDFDEYLNDLLMAKTPGTLIELQAVGFMYERNIILFEPYDLGQPFLTRPYFKGVLRVFCTIDRHFDSVFTCDFIKVAAMSQAICYEILYKDVFKLPDVEFAVEYMLHATTFYCPYEADVNGNGYCTSIKYPNGRFFSLDLPENTNCILENEELCKFHCNRHIVNEKLKQIEYNNGSNIDENIKQSNTVVVKAEPLSDNNDDGSVGVMVKPVELLPHRYISCVRQLLLEGITPFPYKVAKALEPTMYRNIEFDAWNEARKELRMLNWYNGDNHFKVGAKCHVKMAESDILYTCHVQEISSDKSWCHVFVEETGEKRWVPYKSLIPLPPENFKPWSLPYRLQRHLRKYAAAALTSSSSTREYSRNHQLHYRAKFLNDNCIGDGGADGGDGGGDAVGNYADNFYNYHHYHRHHHQQQHQYHPQHYYQPQMQQPFYNQAKQLEYGCPMNSGGGGAGNGGTGDFYPYTKTTQVNDFSFNYYYSGYGDPAAAAGVDDMFYNDHKNYVPYNNNVNGGYYNYNANTYWRMKQLTDLDNFCPQPVEYYTLPVNVNNANSKAKTANPSIRGGRGGAGRGGGGRGGGPRSSRNTRASSPRRDGGRNPNPPPNDQRYHDYRYNNTNNNTIYTNANKNCDDDSHLSSSRAQSTISIVSCNLGPPRRRQRRGGGISGRGGLDSSIDHNCFGRDATSDAASSASGGLICAPAPQPPLIIHPHEKQTSSAPYSTASTFDISGSQSTSYNNNNTSKNNNKNNNGSITSQTDSDAYSFYPDYRCTVPPPITPGVMPSVPINGWNNAGGANFFLVPTQSQSSQQCIHEPFHVTPSSTMASHPISMIQQHQQQQSVIYSSASSSYIPPQVYASTSTAGLKINQSTMTLPLKTDGGKFLSKLKFIPAGKILRGRGGQSDVVQIADPVLSDDPDGKDLPQDMQILRYFYNLGVKTYLEMKRKEKEEEEAAAAAAAAEAAAEAYGLTPSEAPTSELAPSSATDLSKSATSIKSNPADKRLDSPTRSQVDNSLQRPSQGILSTPRNLSPQRLASGTQSPASALSTQDTTRKVDFDKQAPANTAISCPIEPPGPINTCVEPCRECPVACLEPRSELGANIMVDPSMTQYAPCQPLNPIYSYCPAPYEFLGDPHALCPPAAMAPGTYYIPSYCYYPPQGCNYSPLPLAPHQGAPPNGIYQARVGHDLPDNLSNDVGLPWCMACPPTPSTCFYPANQSGPPNSMLAGAAINQQSLAASAQPTQQRSSKGGSPPRSQSQSPTRPQQKNENWSESPQMCANLAIATIPPYPPGICGEQPVLVEGPPNCWCSVGPTPTHLHGTCSCGTDLGETQQQDENSKRQSNADGKSVDNTTVYTGDEASVTRQSVGSSSPKRLSQGSRSPGSRSPGSRSPSQQQRK